MTEPRAAQKVEKKVDGVVHLIEDLRHLWTEQKRVVADARHGRVEVDGQRRRHECNEDGRHSNHRDGDPL